MTDGKQKLDYLCGLDPEMPRIIEIELTKLRPNPDQPRKRFNEETIKELASSIEQHGLIQPIVVVPDPESQDGFMIVEPTAQAIHNWVAQADRDEGRRADGFELGRLRRENRQLSIEREILSKAAAWFARETGSIPSKGSNS